jgi:hypothetical protein
MQVKISRNDAVNASSKLFALAFLAVSAWGQTAADLAAKYAAVSAYEVRPGILMTAKYAADGRICEMVLEPRHYQSGDGVDLEVVFPAKLEKEVIDELVPLAERGEPIHRWSKKEPKDSWLDPDSYMAGGMSYYKRSYENVSIEQHGYYRCHDDQNSKKTDGKLDCSEGGDEVVVIRWTKRSCTAGKSNGLMQKVPEGNAGAAAGERVKGNQEIEAEKEAKAGGSPEGDGLSAASGEKFLPLGGTGEQTVNGADEVKGRNRAPNQNADRRNSHREMGHRSPEQ